MKRGFGVGTTDSKFSIDVGGAFKLLVNNLVPRRTGQGEHGAISIDMQYVGRAPSRIFNLDVRNERISMSEYRHAFHAP